MSNIFKFTRRTNSGGPALITWSDKAIGYGNATVGYKAGTIKNGSNIQYSLIVCPRSNGQATTTDLSKSFNPNTTVVPAALSALGNGTTSPTANVAGKYYGSLWDGLSNTNALKTASSTNYQAVNYCKSLTTGGYNDWYLPAKDELDLCYRSFKPTTTANGTNITYIGGINQSITYDATNNPFSGPKDVNNHGAYYTSTNPPRTTETNFIQSGAEAFGGYYWCSCQASNTHAWRYNFDGGNIVNIEPMNGSMKVRPVRRSLL